MKVLNQELKENEIFSAKGEKCVLPKQDRKGGEEKSDKNRI